MFSAPAPALFGEHSGLDRDPYLTASPELALTRINGQISLAFRCLLVTLSTTPLPSSLSYDGHRNPYESFYKSQVSGSHSGLSLVWLTGTYIPPETSSAWVEWQLMWRYWQVTQGSVWPRESLSTS